MQRPGIDRETLRTPVWTIPAACPPSALCPGVPAATNAEMVVFGYQDVGGDYDPGPAADVSKGRALFIMCYA